jgi:hypothetical protein
MVPASHPPVPSLALLDLVVKGVDPFIAILACLPKNNRYTYDYGVQLRL